MSKESEASKYVLGHTSSAVVHTRGSTRRPQHMFGTTRVCGAHIRGQARKLRTAYSVDTM